MLSPCICRDSVRRLERKDIPWQVELAMRDCLIETGLRKAIGLAQTQIAGIGLMAAISLASAMPSWPTHKKQRKSMTCARHRHCTVGHFNRHPRFGVVHLNQTFAVGRLRTEAMRRAVMRLRTNVLSFQHVAHSARSEVKTSGGRHRLCDSPSAS